MINIKNLILNKYENSLNFKLNSQNKIENPYLTNRNIIDFKNPNYNLSKIDIIKYMIVLEYLVNNKNKNLAYYLNPYLVEKYRAIYTSPVFVFN